MTALRNGQTFTAKGIVTFVVSDARLDNIPTSERGPATYYCFDVCVDGEVVVVGCVLLDDEGIAAFLDEAVT